MTTMPYSDGRESKGSISLIAERMRENAPQSSQEDRIADLLAEVRKRIQAQITPAQIEDPADEDLQLARDIIRPLVANTFRQARQSGLRMTHSEDEVMRQIVDEIFGFGPLAPYLADEEIEEIVINGPNDVRIIHSERGRERTNVRFRSATDVINFVNRAASATGGGRWLDRANPTLNARMRDGSRLHVIMEPLTANVPISVTIRRHRVVARTLSDLVRMGTITPLVEEFLQIAVDGRLNVIVAGSTASGKTNFLNAMCNAANDDDRFVIIEDTPELEIDKSDVVQLTTRDQAEEARGFTMADLLVESLRMRPDRIITGEARGAEVVDVLMAANTGHDGQLLTIHANSTRDAITRLETMYLLRGIEVPSVAILRQIADAFQLVIFLKQVFIGNRPKRFVTQIAEVQPSQFMESGKVVVQNIFEDAGQGLAWTGYHPDRLAQRLSQRGISLRPQFFRK